jgi:CRP-like cAMP-binding protein
LSQITLTVFEIFKAYVQKRSQLSEDEFKQIERIARIKKLRKKQYLLQEGDVSRDYAFITSGLLRTYSVDEKGNEHIIRFAMKDWWISDRESLLSGQPSRFNIDAIEDSTILMFAKPQMDELLDTIPAFNRMITDILNKSFITSQNRIHEAISSSSEAKYQNFVSRYAEFALRVPQSMIASYLGIAPETLSRLRNKKH